MGQFINQEESVEEALAFKAGGFKAASTRITDEYMDETTPSFRRRLQGKSKKGSSRFVEAGVTRLIVPYVPVEEPVIEDARRFVEAWGKL